MEDFIKGLSHFDKEGEGFITSAELRQVLTTMGMSVFSSVLVFIHNNFQATNSQTRSLTNW